MEYKFDEKKHLHQLLVDGIWKNLTGCTTVLSVVAKPALISWAANMTADFVKTFISGSENKTFTAAELIPVLEDARKAHAKRKSSAGDKGKAIHLQIELLIRDAIQDTQGYIKVVPQPETTSKSIINFINWASENKVKFLESEKNIYSEKLWIGGILDGLLEIDGDVWIMDIKTASSGLYAENMWQMAGYEIMLTESTEYKKIKGYILLNLKENGEFLEKRSVSNEEHKKAFLACLEIYRQKEKTTNELL